MYTILEATKKEQKLKTSNKIANQLQEVFIRFTTLNVVSHDSDKVISVWSALFVPAPKTMEHLMHDNALVLAAITNGDILRSANSTNIGVTPTQEIIVSYLIILLPL